MPLEREKSRSRKSSASMNDIARHAGIEYPGHDSLFDPIELRVRSNDGRQLLVVSMIDELEQLFARPRSRVFSSQIVEHEQVSVTNLLKPFVIGNAVFWIERRAKLIQKIGNHSKIDRSLYISSRVGVRYRGSEMGLSDVPTFTVQAPTNRRSCVRIRETMRNALSVPGTDGSNAVEGQVTQRVEIRKCCSAPARAEPAAFPRCRHMASVCRNSDCPGSTSNRTHPASWQMDNRSAAAQDGARRRCLYRPGSKGSGADPRFAASRFPSPRPLTDQFSRTRWT